MVCNRKMLSIEGEWVNKFWCVSHYSSEHECTTAIHMHKDGSSKHNVEQKSMSQKACGIIP